VQVPHNMLNARKMQLRTIQEIGIACETKSFFCTVTWTDHTAVDISHSVSLESQDAYGTS